MRLITPYSLYKSRTGGIIGRLLAHAQLELVATRMCVFSDAFIDEYVKMVAAPGHGRGLRGSLAAVHRRVAAEEQSLGLPAAVQCCCCSAGPTRCGTSRTRSSAASPSSPRATRSAARTATSSATLPARSAISSRPSSPRRARNLTRPTFGCWRTMPHPTAASSPARSPTPSRTCRPPWPCSSRTTSSAAPRRPGNIIDTFSLTGLRIVAARLST